MINERFLALPQERQRRLINAGYKVFGLNEYKKASTEEIAREAGISKGYLFYYFRNKKALYFYLYECATKLARTQVMDEGFARLTDPFEMMEYAAEQKARLMADYPYLMEFAMRAYASQHEDVSPALDRRIIRETQKIYAGVLVGLDYSRFRPGIDPIYILRMLQWMGDGWLREAQRIGAAPTADEMLAEFRRMLGTLRSLCYKEEEDERD